MTRSAAAVPVTPEPEHGSGAAESASDVITWADFEAWDARSPPPAAAPAPSGYRPDHCGGPGHRPDSGSLQDLDRVEVPSAEGDTEMVRVDDPLHVACGNRRESVCPACSAVYKRDARQLVRAGLVGGKGVPETVAEHPCVFATFTAPSSARSTPAASATARCCPAVPAATPTSGPARTAATSHARSGTRPMTPASAVRCAPTATTTRLRSRSTLAREAVEAVPHLLSPASGPRCRCPGQGLPRARPAAFRQGRRIPGTRRRPLPRRHPPGRQRQGRKATCSRPAMDRRAA